jgi:hypothetical protein
VILLDDLYAIILRATINHDVLDIRIVLFQDRTDGSFQKLALIIGWGDNGYFGECGV